MLQQYRRLLGTLILFIGVLTHVSLAQSRTVTGVVTSSADGQPLTG